MINSFQILVTSLFVKCLERASKNLHRACVMEYGTELWNTEWCLTCTSDA